MELHSYAKRRAVKKWTIEQKRKLVEARITYDNWFTNKPSSVVPWKNILLAANLDDFNVFFVRKQWSNMLTRYKQYKQNRLGNNIGSKSIDAELIKRINQEWEFFEPIHKFMTRKTTNLHSYALTHRTADNSSGQQEKREPNEQTSATIENEPSQKTNNTPSKLLNNDTITISKPKDCAKENIPNNTTIVIQSNVITPDEDDIQVFSSDTNEEFQVIDDTTRIINSSKGRKLQVIPDEEDENLNCVRNTDHDFYSKRSCLDEMAASRIGCRKEDEDELQEKQSNYFADASEESQGSSNMVIDLIQVNSLTNTKAQSNSISVDKIQTTEMITESPKTMDNLDIKEEINDHDTFSHMPSTSIQNNQTQVLKHPQKEKEFHLSERDKYYRHKRRFNRRLERRFDAVLQVMGQVVKTGYPNVDITPLLGTVTTMTAGMGKLLSSDSDDENKSD